MRLRVAATVAFALVMAGCGASAKRHQPAPLPTSQADRMRAVVRAWTANLNAENNAAEARLFALPATISLMTGPYGCYCLTPAEVAQFHEQLPCAFEIVSIQVRGRYATAVFGRPRDRLISTCDAPPGARTAVRFTIVRGKITAWKQVPWTPGACGPSAKPDQAAPPQQAQVDRMRALVRAWTANVNAENNAGAALLFSLPATISLITAPYGCYCLNEAELARFHAQLVTCSGEILSIEARGRDATAVFRLGDRKTSPCAPAGSLTAVRFTIVNDKFTAMRQVWARPPGGTTIREPGC